MVGITDSQRPYKQGRRRKVSIGKLNVSYNFESGVEDIHWSLMSHQSVISRYQTAVDVANVAFSALSQIRA